MKYLLVIIQIVFFKGCKIELEPCRNCKSEIKPKLRRCPYCGILNPTVKLKEIFIGIAFVLVVMTVVTYFMPQ